VPKRKTTAVTNNAADGFTGEPMEASAVSPVGVLSITLPVSTSFVEDTTTATPTSSVASENKNGTHTAGGDEEMSSALSAPYTAGLTVSNTQENTSKDGDNAIMEDDIVEEIATSQHSQESQDLSSDVDDGPTGNEGTVLREGTYVRITNGTYKGKVGIASRMTEKMVYVTIEGCDKEPRIHKASVEIIEEGWPAQAAATSMPVAKSSAKPTKNKSESSTPFEIGQNIRVINESSAYFGKGGTIVKVNNKMVRISIDGVGEKSLSKKSVKICISAFRTSLSPSDIQLEVPLDCSTGMSSVSLATGIVTPTNVLQIDNDLVLPSPNASGRRSAMSGEFSTLSQEVHVAIRAGKYKGKTARLVKMLPRSLKVQINGQEVTVRKTSVVGYDNKTSKSSLSSNPTGTGVSTGTSQSPPSVAIPFSGSGEEWRVPDSTGGGTRFGSRIVQKIRVSGKSFRDDNTFLSHFLGDRIKIVEVPLLNQNEAMDPFDITVFEDGRVYELMSVKIREDNEGPSMQYCKKLCASLVYCQTRGPRLEPISIETELSKLADFSSLSSRKVMARMELLQSPALKLPSGRPGIFFLNAKEACVIDDNGNDGCGFIDETFLASMLPESKYRDTVAIQIRFLAPSMGIFKGMLMRRRIVEGPAIQLTPTMKKVAASLSNASDDRACLVITQAGKHPSPLNQYIGRMLDPNLKPPPEKSFNAMLKQKPLNKKKLKDKVDMIPRLLLALGVEEATLCMYLKESLKMNGLAHAYVVGVADPTDAIPAGYVFVTGFSNVLTPNGQIFVTRSPCAKASDARMLPMITSKPDAMAQPDWDWFNTLAFGTIIFANPKKGVEPLPAQVANGDLDGDRYFITWNGDILRQVKTDPIVEVTNNGSCGIDKAGVTDKNGKKPNHNWLGEAQQLMIDSVSIQDLGALTGCLYKLAEKTADSSKLCMRDPDAIAYADAYNHALEFGKHGGKINLPSHLHDDVPARLRKHLSEIHVQ